MSDIEWVKTHIAKLVQLHNQLLTMQRAVRRHKGNAALIFAELETRGISQTFAAEYLKPDIYDILGFPVHVLRNVKQGLAVYNKRLRETICATLHTSIKQNRRWLINNTIYSGYEPSINMHLRTCLWCGSTIVVTNNIQAVCIGPVAP